ncbi:MAG TPA: peptide-methionine (S)-S-oxide reductase MsrA [Bacilli bacterium]|nr:peptide-methionine (S)-S-oxide reductase MsrA [Bacilli bacterium]
MIETAIFAGGCFWCMVKPFDRYQGVIKVESGYTGGHTINPTYEEVCSKKTGHVEAVRITFDNEQIAYSTLLDIFWRQIDPTDTGGQFEDRGSNYLSAIFYTSESQKEIANESKKALSESGLFKCPIVTRILPATVFYLAEDYHQDFYKKNPLRFEENEAFSSRNDFISEHWKKK